MTSGNSDRQQQAATRRPAKQNTLDSSKPLHLLTLEERVLYSAAPLPLEMMAHAEAVEIYDVLESADLQLAEISTAFEQLFSEEIEPSLIDLTSLAVDSTEVQTELVIVDRSVADYEQLVDDILANADSNVETQISYVDAGSDGVTQITDLLQQKSGEGLRFDAIHLVSHGDDGVLQLGNSSLSSDNIQMYRDQIGSWQSALSSDADLLIYGCDVAESEVGQSFVKSLAELTGLDVLASDDATGHASLGADWDFEFQLGVIETNALLTVEVRSSWQHELALVDATSADGSASRAVAASDNDLFIEVYSSDLITGSDGKDIYYELSTPLDLFSGNSSTPIRVNDTTTGDQQWATVSMSDNGDMVFVWTSDHAGQLGVYGKMIDANGIVVKSEFQIDQGNGGNNASVAMDDQGNFVVVWESSGDGDPSGDIYGQVFDRFGNTIDSTFQVNTGEANGGDTSGFQGHADVAINESNQFIVSWDNYYDSNVESAIFANKFSFTNTTVTSDSGEFFVHQAFADTLNYNSSTDINNSGEFVVTWTADATDSYKALPFGIGATATANATRVEASSFQANGTLEHYFGGVNSTILGAQENSSVVLLEDNVVVFAWEGESSLSADSEGVYQRRFNFDGTAIDAQEEFVSPLADLGAQSEVSITKFDNTEYAIGFAGEYRGVDGYHIVASTIGAAVPDGMIYSTKGNGWNDWTDWDGGDAIWFDGQFGSPTSGVASVMFDSAFDLDAIHYVTQQVTIDTATPAVLNAGDILFSIGETNTSSIPGLAAATNGDIIRFQPVAPGNYDFASGTFSIIDSLSGVNIRGLTVVEQNTRIGDYDVLAGDILFTGDGPAENDIQLLRITGGVQTIATLIDGDDVGLELAIMGLDLVERQTNLDGLTLNSGTLLLSSQGNETVGVAGANDFDQDAAGGLDVQDNDIYALEFTTTTLGIGVATANPSLFFDASTVQYLSSGAQADVDAISLLTIADPSLAINDAPTNLTSGVQLNSDDGNDAYFQAGNGDILAGLSEFTVELSFNAQYSDYTPLVSYETPTGDDLEIVLIGDGSLHVKVDNAYAGSLTGIDYDTLMNGSIVNFSFSWDNTNGDWAVMVDGVVTDQGTGLAAGQTLASGGELIFGQDQDSVGGGFLYDEVFSGTFHDIRIWDEVRTVEEISLNQNHKFDSNNIPPGLIANWQMTNLLGGTTVVDLVNPGSNDLTLGHASGANFMASTPSDSLNVDENSANGTIVGHVMPTDTEYSNDVVKDGLFLKADATDPDVTHYFADGSGSGSLVGDWTVVQESIDVKGSNWQSSPLGGRVVDLTGDFAGIIQQSISTEIGKEYTIYFALSGNFEGTETQMDMAVNVDGTPTNFTYMRQAGWGITNLMWQQQSITFTATSTSTILQFESLELVGFRGALIGDVQVMETSTAGDGIFSFNLTDDAGGRFAIDSVTGEITVADQTGLDFETDTAHTITIEVTDPGGDSYVQDLVIGVSDVNESPVLPVNNGMTVVNTSSGTVISSSMLNADDVDDSPAELTYTITSNVTNGSLWLSGVQLSNGDSFSQQDINDGNLSYDHNGSMAVDSFDFTLVDGGEDGASGVSDTFNISATNFEQVVSTNAGLTIDEGTSLPITQSLLETFDADHLPAQIAYTIISGPNNGTLLVAGVASSTFSQADINAGQVSYVHNGSETTSDSFDFDVDDGQGVVSSATFNLTINPVNDEQSLDTNAGLTLSEGASATIDNTLLATSDADNTPLQIVYTVDTASSNGTVFLSGVALGAADTFTQDDINNGRITYQHNGGETTSDSFDFTVDDGAGSTTSATFNLTINPVNDEQSLGTNAGLTLSEGASGTIDNTALSTSDVDNTPLQIVYTVDAATTNGTVLLSGVALNASDTFTQDDIDNGRITYQHNGGETTSDSFDFTVDDGTGTTTSATFNLTINPVNDEQTVNVNVTPASVTEGGSTLISSSIISASDVDNPPSELVFSVTGPPAHGTILLNGSPTASFTQADVDNNRVSYQHNGSETASDSLNLSVDDGQGSASIATINFNILSVNDSPTLLVNNGITVAEGSTATSIGTSNLFTSDPDDSGAGLTYTLSANVAHGTIRLNGLVLGVGQSFTQADIDAGNVTYDHDGSETTTDSFDFSLADGGEDGATPTTGIFQFTIIPTNDAPDLNNTLTNTLTDVVRYATDPVGDTVASIIASAGGNQITDGDNFASEGIAVVGVDDSSGQWQYSTDNGGTWISFSSVGVANGVVDETSAVVLDENAKIRFVPNPGYYGDAGDVTFKAWDQTDNLSSGTTLVDATHADNTSPFSSVTDTATLDVLHSNILPNTNNDDLGLVANLGPTIINIANLLSNDADPNGGTPQLIDFTQPDHGTIIDNGDGTLTYTPDNGYSGPDQFQYTIDDGQDGLEHYWSFANGGSDSVGGNDATNHGAQSVDGSFGDAMSFDDTLMEYIEIPDVSYSDDFTLSFDFNIDDNDGTGLRSVYSHGSFNTPDSLNIYFREANNPSVAPNTLATSIRDPLDPIQVHDLDIDASSLIGGWHTYTLVVENGVGATVFIDGVKQASTSNGGDSINPTGNVFIGSQNDLNVNRFFDGSLDTFKIYDRAMPDAEVAGINISNSSQTATVTLTVNTPPTANPEAFSTNSMTPVVDSVAGNDSDVNGHALTYSTVSGPVNGTFNLNADGSFTYTPGANQSGTESITYRVTDPFGAEDTATITIDVDAVPVANDDVVQINVGESVIIDVLSNDADAENQLDPSSIQLVGGGPSHGSISLTTTGNIVYVHDNSGNMTDSFQYTIKDQFGNVSNVATVDLAINQAPTNIAISNDQVDENVPDGTLVGSISADDPENDNITFHLTDDASNRFDIDPITGAITIETGTLIDFEDGQSHGITVVATDEHGVSTTKAFTITVNDINEAPDVAVIQRSLFQGMTITGDVAASATDPESDTLTYRLTGQPAHGIVTMNSDGTWQYQHNDSQNFVDGFDFVVEDTAGNQTLSSVLFDVIPAESPIANPDAITTSSVVLLTIDPSSLLANDANVGSGAHVEITKLPQNGTLVTTANGTLAYIPNISFEGIDTFEYRVLNPTGKTSQSAVVNIDVENMGASPSPPVETINTDNQDDMNVPPDVTVQDDPTGSGPDNSQADSSEDDSGVGALPNDIKIRYNFADHVEIEDNDSDLSDRNSNSYRLASSRYVTPSNYNSIEFDGSTFNRINRDITSELSSTVVSLAVNFWQDLDDAKNNYQHSLGFDNTSFVAATSSMLTVGYLVWMVRAGALLSTFVSSMPAWQTFDPLPVIESGIAGKFNDDEDTLEKIVDNE